MLVNHRGNPVEVESESDCATLGAKVQSAYPAKIIAVRVNRKDVDLSCRLKEGDAVEFFTFEENEGREVFWHTSAHVLAQAVLRHFPDAKPTIGPPIEQGFYYDFARLDVGEEDLGKIEAEMAKIVAENHPTERVEFESKEEALERFGGNPFKKELIESFDEGLSAYRQGEFFDLCRGPHLDRLGRIEAFKILRTSGAYWRADAENEQLTRIYGISFPDKKRLREHLSFLEEAKKRDHRVLGTRLNLFSFHPESPGMPLFHPGGMVVWEELMKFWHEKHAEAGYRQIKTPLILNRSLWETSGHWENYRENMYTTRVDEEDYVIKPMNCPGCCLYYKTNQYSYRQLPLRIAEIGHVHRNELSGALSGLFRVRCFHQDDSHLFLIPEQLKEEIVGIVRLADEIYGRFGLEYRLELSTRPEKSIGSDEQWKFSTEGLKNALDFLGRDYKINEGDGAFYGPKIDFHIRDAIGRYWQCGTIQLDMNLPERFDMLYDSSDVGKARPVMLHRTIYGSIERFLGILVEHFKGRFPCWLSPEAVRLLPVGDRHVGFCEDAMRLLTEKGLRASVDSSAETVGKKVRNAQFDQVNYMLVVGDREKESGLFRLRTRENRVCADIGLDALIDAIVLEKERRSLISPFSESQ